MLCNICPFIPLPICTSVIPTSIYTPIYPSISPPAPSMCPSVHPLVYPTIHPFIHLPLYPSIHLPATSICLSIHPSILLASEHYLVLNVLIMVPSQGHCYQQDVAFWKLGGLSFISPKASPCHLFFLFPRSTSHLSTATSQRLR